MSIEITSPVSYFSFNLSNSSALGFPEVKKLRKSVSSSKRKNEIRAIIFMMVTKIIIGIDAV